MIESVTAFVLEGGKLTYEEGVALAHAEDKEALYEGAYRITRHFGGNRFDTCSILNARSGNCTEDCKWCAQSARYATQTDTYPLLPAAECVRHAMHNRKQGIGRFALVTSGRRLSSSETTALCNTVREIKKHTDIACCASLGLLTREQLRQLRESGVENYHCNIETAPSYFPRLCTTHTIAEKVATLQAAREAGFRICSGGIIGMGETMEQRVEMAVFLQRHEVRSIPLNLLQPIPGTPLEHTAPLSEEEFLTTVALFRYINPQAYLRFSGGRSLLPEHTQRKALHIGINAAITGDMLTTAGSNATADRRLFASEGYSFTENTDWER